MALNTGARGLATTLHSDSALDALYRLEDLLRAGKSLPLWSMIVRFVDLVVYMHMAEDGRRSIGDVQRVMGVNAAGDYILESVR
jgi:type IV secretion system protein VirB11